MDFSVGNASIENARIWASGGVLHLQSAEPCDALIHTLSGALVQRLRLSAGEDMSLSLAKGCYFVTIGKKTYKVVL
ncbi:MAG: T9SS type A sorting domain-containing protein [Tannerella sp.]|nr:T9SS type A sorting domain-containing protein [Tannerella sp.]